MVWAWRPNSKDRTNMGQHHTLWNNCWLQSLVDWSRDTLDWSRDTLDWSRDTLDWSVDILTGLQTLLTGLWTFWLVCRHSWVSTHNATLLAKCWPTVNIFNAVLSNKCVHEAVTEAADWLRENTTTTLLTEWHGMTASHYKSCTLSMHTTDRYGIVEFNVPLDTV